MSLKHWIRVGGAVACLAAFAPLAQAAPWFEAGDVHARHKLQQAVDRGQLNATLSAWPVAHSNALLATDDGRELRRDPFFADIQHYRLGGSARLHASAVTETPFIRGFGGGPREPGTVGVTLEYIGDHLAGALSASYAIDPADNKDVRFDGSYLSFTAYNWILGGGAIDRWWGPGWQSSLVLSNNARPIPSVWLNRRNTSAFESRWLNWIGPWQMTLLGGQMETDRHIPEAKLVGMRINFRPFHSGLEVGLSRLIQWGGEGRPQSASSFWDAFIGRDNLGAVHEDPGNQLAGIDLRYGFAWGDETVGLYMHMVGEDEAGGFPSRKIYQFGMDWTSSRLGGTQQWYLEGIDTMAEGLFGDGMPNYSYEHHTYRSGMRYRGRNLANTFDSDARAVTLGLFHFTERGSQWSAALSWADLNRDGQNRTQTGRGHVDYAVPRSNQDILLLDLGYRRPTAVGEVGVFLQLTSERVELLYDELSPAVVGIEWQLRL